MSAIDNLKEQRDEVVEKLRAARAEVADVTATRDLEAARYAETLTQLRGQVDRLQVRRDRLTQAIRDLTDNWTPAP